MGYMGFGMQKWIYTMKPRKYQEYQLDNSGHEILGYKKMRNHDPEILEDELRSVNERISAAKKATIDTGIRILFGVILIAAIIAIIIFT